MTGALKCDLLTKNPKNNAVLSFCTLLNATQLIIPPEFRKTSSTMVDTVLVSNPNLIKAFIKKGIPKIYYRSFKNYSDKQFPESIPWDTFHVIDSIYNKLDAFNDLFIACLNQHLPVKTFRSKGTSTLFITAGIKELRNNERINSKSLSKPETNWTGKSLELNSNP